jgi:BON domain
MNSRDVLLGAGIGAALVYMIDPNNGRRRRALARDQMVRMSRKTRDAADSTFRDLANRTRGIVATSRRSEPAAVDDATLVERVRAKLGRVSSHPRAIEVDARDGVVTLRGPILAREADQVVGTIESVRGVTNVSDQLERHDTAEGVPSLQGEGNVPGLRLDIFQSNWAPATQAIVAAAGLAATGVCLAAMTSRR